MKKTWLLSAMVLLSKVIGAQDYQISFAVSGDNETIIDSLVVHNIDQDRMITLQGDDTLHLVASMTGISELKTPNDRVEIYPNPFIRSATIVFQNHKQGPVRFSLFDMAGKVVAQKRQYQPPGKTVVEVSGLQAGAYVIQIDTETSIFSEVILSNEGSGNMPEIKFIASGEDAVVPVKTLKSSNRTGEMVHMQYNEGDTLSFKAYLGNISSDVKIVPVASSMLSFDFQTKKENMSASADIAVEGGVLQVTDESGNSIKLTFPPGAVMDTTTVTLTLLGEQKDLPIDERQLRTFEIKPLDLSLYEPVIITIEYNSPRSDIEKAALYRIRSEDWLTPLSDHKYSEDNRSVTASTLIPGEFGEGKMTLEEINTQLALLVSSLGISWESSLKAAGGETQLLCDTRIHKAIWDDWKDVLGSFISFFKQRYLLGYYNDLQEGQHTYEEEQELLCTNVASKGIGSVLDQCIPDDQCDRDYTHTIASMVHEMKLLGCADSTVDLLGDRYDQILLDCSSFLTVSSTLNIESGGLIIFTSGIVPITTQLNNDKTATVEGAGTLTVSGSADGGGLCSGIVSGETFVTVHGSRDAAYTFELQVFTEQDAVLTTVCPDVTVDTPLAEDDLITITLSMANGYSYSLETPVEGGTYVLDITLDNPYISLPYEE